MIAKTIWLSLSLLVSASWIHAEQPADPKNLSLKLEVKAAIGRGLDFLATNQNAGGYWSTDIYPGLSALAIQAFLEAPLPPPQGRDHPAARRGVAYLVSKAQPDGGIYTPEQGLANYNTAISLVALYLNNDPAHDPLLQRARAFVVGQQQLDYDPSTDAAAYLGGIGYGNSYRHSDMSNTSLAIDALHRTRDLLERSAEAEDAPRLDWEAALGFLSRSQNLPDTNPLAWASDDPINRGGFIYFPGDSKAGEMDVSTDAGTRTALRSYGSMSYAGLMSLCYAQLGHDDPRVTSVLEWISKNWTLEENPGLGAQGLYYYYMTLPKALIAAGIDKLNTPEGAVDWREELAVRLLNLQQEGGFWKNDAGRWMESDPNLVTAYTLLALNRIYPDL
ncbi:MAG: prenyltransferase/squalene oxidase repeat-containing protein [Opitutales bacterium]